MIREDFKVHRDAAGKRRAQRPRQTVSRVISTRVDPLVWSAVLRLSGGDMSRVTVISPTEVRVK